MSTATVTSEDYLGAIYRLRETPETPLPLSQLQEHFNFTRVSVHEMALKLAQCGWLTYYPYRGVTLTAEGERIAAALVRRHRLWERFLTDMLDLPWDEAHAIAERLEHAAPEAVTEKLAGLLGEPTSCPHGGPIPPALPAQPWAPLSAAGPGRTFAIVRIFPEVPETLHQLAVLGIGLHTAVQVRQQTPEATGIVLSDGREVTLPVAISATMWVTPA